MHSQVLWCGEGPCSSWEMKTNPVEESPACRKMLENQKVQLATPREATITGIFYFKVHLRKQISSSLCSSVAAAPRTLPKLTAMSFLLVSWDEPPPSKIPATIADVTHEAARAETVFTSQEGLTARPAPVQSMAPLGCTYGFFPPDFSPPVSPFQLELLCEIKRVEKGTLAALCGTSSDYLQDCSSPFSDQGKHFSFLLGKALLPSWPLPFAAASLPHYRMAPGAQVKGAGANHDTENNTHNMSNLENRLLEVPK